MGFKFRCSASSARIALSNLLLLSLLISAVGLRTLPLGIIANTRSMNMFNRVSLRNGCSFTIFSYDFLSQCRKGSNLLYGPRKFLKLSYNQRQSFGGQRRSREDNSSNSRERSNNSRQFGEANPQRNSYENQSDNRERVVDSRQYGENDARRKTYGNQRDNRERSNNPGKFGENNPRRNSYGKQSDNRERSNNPGRFGENNPQRNSYVKQSDNRERSNNPGRFGESNPQRSAYGTQSEASRQPRRFDESQNGAAGNRNRFDRSNVYDSNAQSVAFRSSSRPRMTGRQNRQSFNSSRSSSSPQNFRNDSNSAKGGRGNFESYRKINVEYYGNNSRRSNFEGQSVSKEWTPLSDEFSAPHSAVDPSVERTFSKRPGQSASKWMDEELGDVWVEPGEEKEEDEGEVDNLYGISSVLNALNAKRRSDLLELFVQEGINPRERKDRVALVQIQQLAEEAKLKVTFTNKGYLNSLCGNRPHQGFVLRARPLEFEPISYLSPPPKDANVLPGSSPLWIALDEVTDPQNMGAVLRSAHFFGANGVVTCSKNSASLSSTVSKASSGALEVMPVHSTSNMMKFLRQSRVNGWRVVGTALGSGSVPLQSLSNTVPTIVVLGNEGHGLRSNVVKECEIMVEVQGSSRTESTVDSLNVSVTGAILMFALRNGSGISGKSPEADDSMYSETDSDYES